MTEPRRTTAMPRRKNTPKPAPIELQNLRARAERAPCASNPNWWWRARLVGRHGQPVWSGRGTRAEVERVLMNMLLNGGLEPPVEEESCDTVADLLAFWLGRFADMVDAGERRKATLHGYKAGRSHLRRLIGKTPVESLNTGTLREYITARKRQGAADGTINQEMDALSAALTFGIERELIAKRPRVPRIPNPRPRRKKHTPTKAEVGDLLTRLSGWPRMVVLLQFSTGMRVGEVAHLRREHLDLDDGSLTVPEEGKSGSRFVPLPPHVVSELRRWLTSHDDVRVMGVAPETVKSGMSRTLRGSGITGHGLRRLAVDAMLEAGVPVHVAARFTGHSPTIMMRFYAQVRESQLRDASKQASLGVVPAGKVYQFGDTGA
jgi:integrase